MLSSRHALIRLGLITVFATAGVLVIFFLAGQVAFMVLQQFKAEQTLAALPATQPDRTLFLLTETIKQPGPYWPATVLLVLGLAALVGTLWGLRKKYLLADANAQNIALDESLRQTQKKWRQTDLLNKDLHQQISVMHERVSDSFIFVNANGEIIHANTKATQFFEKNLSLEQDLKGTQLSLMVPGYQDTDFGKALEATVKKNKATRIEAELAKHVWIQARLYPTAKGVFVYFTDISRQKSAKVKVETSVSLLRQILDSALQPSAITDKNWNFVAANKQWLTQFKQKSDDILGQFFGQALPDGLINLKEIGQQVQQGDAYKTEERPLKIGGIEEWIVWEVHPWWDDDGSLGGFIVLATFTTELRRRREQAVRHREKERQLAYYDNLTGLPNRQLFYDQLNQSLAHAYRTKDTVALMFLDLDGFKAINDNIGHDAGDALLREVAQRLQDTVRGTDVVARLGGDEFTIVLGNVKGTENIKQIAEKIIHQIDKPFKLNDQEARVTTSVGVSIYPAHGSTAVELIKSADTAMYQAKNSGKNQFCIFEGRKKDFFPEGDDNSAKILQEALHKNQLELHYQPQTEGVHGRVVGIEALLRWRHPQHGLLDPMDFLPEAESSGAIIEIGKWTLEEACRQNMLWRKEGLGEFTVSVNISPNQFRDASLSDAIDNALEKASLPADALGVEISEMLINDYPQTTLETINALKLKGVKILIDDFGVKKSSLKALKDFPVDTIKIHQSYIKSLNENDENKAIVKNIISLATDLSIDVIGEGVENHEQADFLLHNGCKYLQGFLSGRPIKPTATADFLHDKNLTTSD